LPPSAAASQSNQLSGESWQYVLLLPPCRPGAGMLNSTQDKPQALLRGRGPAGY